MSYYSLFKKLSVFGVFLFIITQTSLLLEAQDSNNSATTNESQKTGSGPKRNAIEQRISKSWLQEIKKSNPEQNASDSGATKPQAIPNNSENPQADSPADSPVDSLNNNAGSETKTQPVFREEVEEDEAPSLAFTALRFVFFLALLVIIFYFGVRFFRLRNKNFFRRGDDLVEVLVSVPLVQGKFIQIVDVAGQLLVLGVSESGVQLLTPLKDGISVDKIRLWQSRKSSESDSSASAPTWLAKFVSLLKGDDLRYKNSDRKSSFSSFLGQFTAKEKSPNDEAEDKTAQLKRLLMRQKSELSKDDKLD